MTTKYDFVLESLDAIDRAVATQAKKAALDARVVYLIDVAPFDTSMKDVEHGAVGLELSAYCSLEKKEVMTTQLHMAPDIEKYYVRKIGRSFHVSLHIALVVNNGVTLSRTNTFRSGRLAEWNSETILVHNKHAAGSGEASAWLVKLIFDKSNVLVSLSVTHDPSQFPHLMNELRLNAFDYYESRYASYLPAISTMAVLNEQDSAAKENGVVSAAPAKRARR
jgi:hypothetical protein